MTIKRIIETSLAIAEKDLKLDLRYKFNFFSKTVISPLTTVLPFLLVYSGYFFVGGKGLSDISSQTFVPFLLIGTVANIILRQGFNAYLQKFKNEKYWQTLENISIAPINKISLIIAGAIDSLVSIAPGILVVTAVASLFYPTSITVIAPLFFLIVFALIISLCLGLIGGLAGVFNENYSTVFSYSLVALVFLSCFYYPISFFDNHPFLRILKVLVLINPYYHIVELMRAVWFGAEIHIQPVLYVTLFVVALPFISAALFSWAWKRFSIEGY